MDRNEQSELISAYLDGEATPAERAEAERLLEASPELRAELNDFARLSDLVRGLPRESAPVELADAIRRQAEQKSLLGTSPAAPKRSLRREWLAALAGMAVTAAAWMVTVQTLGPQRGRTPVAQIVGSTAEGFADRKEASGWRKVSQSDAAPASRTYLERQEMASDDKRHELAEELKENSAKVLTPRAPTARFGAELNAPEAAAKPGAMAAGALGGFGFGGANGRLMESDLAWDLVRIGDVLPYLERTSDGVAVVELTVVDIAEAGGQFEVFLQKNGLQLIPEANAKRAAANRAESKKGVGDKAAATTANANNLMVVYVDAPRETIAQVLEGLAQEHVFSRAKLQPPVDGPQMAFDDAELVATAKDQDRQAEASDAEQSQVNEAVEVIQNYAARRLETNNLAGLEQATSQSRLRKSNVERDAALKQDGEQRGAVGAEKSGRRRVVQDSALKRLDDEPADAFAATVLGRQPTFNYRQQTKNMAVAVEVDEATGQLANDNLGRQKPASAPLLAGKQGGMQSKSKLAEALGDGIAARKADELAEDEALPEPTIRVLFVLQRAEAGAAP